MTFARDFDCSVLDSSFAEECLNIHNLFENCRRDDRFIKGGLFEHATAKQTKGTQYQDEHLSDVRVNGVNLSCKISQLLVGTKKDGSPNQGSANVPMNNIMGKGKAVDVFEVNSHNDLYVICTVHHVQGETKKTVYLSVFDKGIEQFFKHKKDSRMVTFSFDATKCQTIVDKKRIDVSEFALCHESYEFVDGGNTYSEETKRQLKQDIFDFYLGMCQPTVFA